MTYEEIIERASISAQKSRPDVSLPRLRVAVEAAWTPTLREVSEFFVAMGKGDELRQNVPLTFVNGSVALPGKVLLKHLKHARLFTADDSIYSYEREGTDLASLDGMLGTWKLTGTTVEARTPVEDTEAAPLDGNATLDAVCVPDTPAEPDDDFTGPEDMTPQLIEALASKATMSIGRKAA